VVAATNANGQVVAQMAYDAFGKVLSQSGQSQDLRYAYTGRPMDKDIGLQYNRARYYDSFSARWDRLDEYRGNLIVPASLQRYVYVNSNPISARDPSGNKLLSWGCASGLISFLTSTVFNGPVPMSTLTQNRWDLFSGILTARLIVDDASLNVAQKLEGLKLTIVDTIVGVVFNLIGPALQGLIKAAAISLIGSPGSDPAIALGVTFVLGITFSVIELTFIQMITFVTSIAPESESLRFPTMSEVFFELGLYPCVEGAMCKSAR
jgi:RHS repeat-associated protein